MPFSRLILALALLCALSARAEAARNPTPPPSGIVVHLFGPACIMSKITPTLPGQSAKPPGNQLAASATAPQVDTDNPTIGSVLHQMFVVGDPDHPSTPSIGRANDRPP